MSGPLHGYAVARRIKEAFDDRLVIEDGSLYPALNRMLVKGWLKAEWGISENNRNARFYKLTRDGPETTRGRDREIHADHAGRPGGHANGVRGWR